MARFKVVCMFLLGWLAAAIVWNVLLRMWSASHPDGRITQGLAAANMV